MLSHCKLCVLHCSAGIVGPALSALDAHISYALGAATRAKDARRAAQHAAAAQEARAMLGGLAGTFGSA
jgi:hypothetical protein